MGTTDPALSILKLHFNEETMVTLKHKVVRLVGPEFGGRKEAVKGTPECVPAHLCQQQHSTRKVVNIVCIVRNGF